MNDYINTAIETGWEPVKKQEIYEWAKDNVSLPPCFAITGKFSINRSRYMLEPFKSLKNPAIRQVNICAAVQTGKSLIGQLFLPWKIVNDRGICSYICQSDEMAKQMVETRLNPIFHNTVQIKDLMPKDRHSIKNLTLSFPHMTVFIRGAKEKFLQSNSIKTIIMDEVHLWKAGFIELAKSRCTYFPNTNKLLLLSQPNDEDSEWNKEYKKGMQYEWGYKCFKCNTLQPYVWSEQRLDGTYYGIIFNEDKSKGLAERAKSAHFECKHCKATIVDTPNNRRRMNDEGAYIKVEDGDPTTVSYSWNAMANMDIQLSKLVVEYIQAKNEYNEMGIQTAIKIFYNQRLAQFWKEGHGMRSTITALGEFDVNAEWPEEKYRFLTVDCQDMLNYGMDSNKRLYATAAAWSHNEVRILHSDWCATFNDVEALRDKYKIKHIHTGIDSGDSSTLVYNECAKHGRFATIGGKQVWVSWIAFKGSDTEFFNHKVSNNVLMKKFYKPEQLISAAINKGFTQQFPCRFYLWSHSIMDTLQRIRDNKGNFKLVLPEENKEFTAMMNAEMKKKVTDKKTNKPIWRWTQIGNRRNEAWDTMSMQCIFAHMVNLI